MEKTSDQTLKLEVEGMSCENCAIKVESVLRDLPEINESKVNLADKQVEVKGNAINVESVRDAITKAGYIFKKIVD